MGFDFNGAVRTHNKSVLPPSPRLKRLAARHNRLAKRPVDPGDDKRRSAYVDAARSPAFRPFKPRDRFDPGYVAATGTLGICDGRSLDYCSWPLIPRARLWRGPF